MKKKQKNTQLLFLKNERCLMKHLKLFENFEDPFEQQLDNDLHHEKKYVESREKLDDLLEDKLAEICKALYNDPNIKFFKTKFSDHIKFTYKDVLFEFQQYYDHISITYIDSGSSPEEIWNNEYPHTEIPITLEGQIEDILIILHNYTQE